MEESSVTHTHMHTCARTYRIVRTQLHIHDYICTQVEEAAEDAEEEWGRGDRRRPLLTGSPAQGA